MANDTVFPPAPVSANERMHILDIIRGFALLGILLMNIEYFQRPLQSLMLGLNTEQSGLDYAVAWSSFTFVQGKFYTMFSLLFGLGFIVFIDRAQQQGAAAKSLFKRRLCVLLGFGVVHLLLIWGGDILHFYALVGFVLLLFINKPVKTLVRFAALFFMIPMFITWMGALAIDIMLRQPELAAELLTGFAEDKAKLLDDIARGELLYATGGYWEVVHWRWYEFRALYFGPGLLIFVPMIISMFLLGAALARAGVFSDLTQYARLFQQFRRWGFAIGLPCALIWGLYGHNIDVTFPTYRSAALLSLSQIANISLCLAYIGSLVWLYQRRSQLVLMLAPAGRMALTNYLMHSVVFTLLFYGYGLGLYGEFGRAATTVMALLLFSLQLWFSQYWLARFKYGPAEWLWRSLTYRSWQPMR